jgi:hypothetical protein
MPKSGPARKSIGIRLADAGRQNLEQRAGEETSGNMSELVRRLIAYGSTRMPKGWNG